MDQSTLRQLVAGLSRAQIEELVESLTADEVRALEEMLPRVDGARRDIAAEGPAEFAGALDPGYRRRPHVVLLSDAVRRTVEEAQTGAGPGRLIVNMPPRVGKSYTSSLWTPAWFLERYPDRNVILASHEANYAVSWGRKVRDLLRRHEPDLQVRLARDVSAAGEWETTLGGGMLSRGIGGSITGRGGHLFLIDDPLKDFAQAHSLTVRAAQWNWWLSTAQTRLEPGAAVIVVMTRWHEDDLSGRLTSPEFEGSPDDWNVLRIPALGEGAAPPEAKRVPPDALGRDDGAPLMLASSDEGEADAGTRWEAIRKSVGPYVWNGMFQQRPSEPEGTILRRAWWQYYRRAAEGLVRPDGSLVSVAGLRIVQSWDMAFKDRRSSDYVVGQVWGVAGIGDRFLLEQVRDRMDFVAAKRAMRQLRSRWPTTEATWIEDAANGPAIISELRRELSGLVPITAKGSKEARAWSVQGILESGSVWLPAVDEAEWVREFVQECAEFPNGTNDDQVDAFTQAMNRLRSSGTEVGRPSGGLDRREPTLPTTKRTIARG